MIDLHDIQQARSRLTGIINHTPLIRLNNTKSDECVYLKAESFQPIGSFKIRGAYNRIAELFDPENKFAASDIAGVIAYSSGNHAQGVAYAAQRFNLPAIIVMPFNAPKVKIEATRSYGAEVVLYDPATEKREEVAQGLMDGKSYVLVPPFDDPFVIAGQGTIGIEIIEDFQDVEQVITPVGGGGLISGIATAIKALKPSVSIIGVEPVLAADAQASLHSGHIVSMTAAETARTIADGVRTVSLSPLTFAHIQEYVDEIITVSEEEITDATRHLLINSKLVIEPSGALPLAAYLYHKKELPDVRNTVLVLSGGNVDPVWLTHLLNAPSVSIPSSSPVGTEGAVSNQKRESV